MKYLVKCRARRGRNTFRRSGILFTAAGVVLTEEQMTDAIRNEPMLEVTEVPDAEPEVAAEVEPEVEPEVVEVVEPEVVVECVEAKEAPVEKKQGRRGKAKFVSEETVEKQGDE